MFNTNHNANYTNDIIESMMLKHAIAGDSIVKSFESFYGKVESIECIVECVPKHLKQIVYAETAWGCEIIFASKNRCQFMMFQANDSDGLKVFAWGDDAVVEAAKKIVAEKFIHETKQTVMLLVVGPHGPMLQSVPYKTQPLEHGNYMPDVQRAFDKIVEDIDAQKPAGRIAILQGPPGTGKTNMIKAIMQATPGARHVIVPADLIPQLAGPSLVQALIPYAGRRLVLIAEDADNCVKNRDDEKGNASDVSNMLNLTDGMVGELLNIYVIATTNVPNVAFDPAIMRPGRLSVNVNIHELDRETANKAYFRITDKNKSYERPVILAQVYADAREVK